MKTAGLIGLCGLLIVTGLIAWQGAHDILGIFASAGLGIVIASAFHIVSMALNARAWQILLPGRDRPSTLFFIWAVWLREAVNGLLPVARIGGEVATAQFLIRHGVSSRQAVASLVVDVTVSLGSQYVFTMIGVGLLLLGSGHADIVRQVALGALVILPMAGAFWVIQRHGLFSLLAKVVNALFGNKFEAMVGNAGALDLTVRRFYQRKAAILSCCVWQLAGWLAGAGQIYLLLLFMNHPVSYGDALIIEALIQALSSGAFVVPGAIGIQEGGFVVIGGLVGLPADISLALALARRARDVMLYVPALLIAQIKIGRDLMLKTE